MAKRMDFLLEEEGIAIRLSSRGTDLREVVADDLRIDIDATASISVVSTLLLSSGIPITSTRSRHRCELSACGSAMAGYFAVTVVVR